MSGARGILATQPERVNHTPSGGGVALAAGAAGPGFPSPIAAQRTLRGDVTPHSPWLDPSPRADRRDRLDLHQHSRIGQLVDGHVAQGWTRRRETAASRFGVTLRGLGADTVTIVGIELQHVIEACARRSQDVGHVAYDKLCLLRPISRTDHVAVFVERRLTADERSPIFCFIPKNNRLIRICSRSSD